MTQPQGQSQSIWLRKTGPLPNWVWAGMLLLAALVYSLWQRNKEDTVAVDEEQTTEETAGDQTAPPVFILPQSPQPAVNVTVPVTVPSAPPAGGRPTPPTTTPSKPVVIKKPTPVPSAPGKWVTVTKYPDNKKPKESTLWDIAAEYLGSGSKWTSIWNDAENAKLKSLRKDPKKIQPGDKFFVRGAKTK